MDQRASRAKVSDTASVIEDKSACPLWEIVQDMQGKANDLHRLSRAPHNLHYPFLRGYEYISNF